MHWYIPEEVAVWFWGGCRSIALQALSSRVSDLDTMLSSSLPEEEHCGSWLSVVASEATLAPIAAFLVRLSLLTPFLPPLFTSLSLCRISRQSASYTKRFNPSSHNPNDSRSASRSNAAFQNKSCVVHSLWNCFDTSGKVWVREEWVSIGERDGWLPAVLKEKLSEVHHHQCE